MTAFHYLRPEMYKSPDQLREVAAYHTKRQDTDHIFCHCNLPETNMAVPKMVRTAQIKRFQEAKYAELTDKQKCKSLNKCFAADPAKGRVMPPKHIVTLHSFLAHGWSAMPYVTMQTVDWSHIDDHYDGDREWFSIAVYVARCTWQRLMAPRGTAE